MDMTMGDSAAIWSHVGQLHKNYTQKKEIEKAVLNYDEMVANLMA